MNVLAGVNIYAISDTGFEHRDYFNQLLNAGVDLVQLRDKELSDRKFYQLASELRRLTNDYNKTFIINDRIDIAIAVDADGVHLGEDDLPVDIARSILGDSKILGCSSHNLKEAKEACVQGADYISVGPIFKSKTKKTLEPISFHEIELIKSELTIPQVAIGGIGLENIEVVKKMGFRNVAMIQALLSSDDKKTLIFKIRKVLENDIN